ncbi:MAG: choice-of-anchor J domain-containing protein [Bacteroidales bacterium]|nr:choice-of-anchor J domain-containing protein [Bacteroidales bacterium]MBK9358086.1 choice-of-anchor J domain-containing protein [Bacteroidales bacterium]
MKKIWQLFAGLFLILASTTFTACVDGEFDEPPINIPTVDFERNTTIAELKASYTAFTMIEDDIIISGIVIANDESGNLYKKMEIQDETGGIELSLDKTSLYNEYKLGQRVFIKCKGMYIGDYNNLIQLGYLYNGDIGRLPEIYIAAHIFRDSLPGPVVQPELITLNDLTMDRVSTLVTFENVRFAEVGEVWAPQDVDATNRTLMDQGGKTLIVRTSKYSNFASDSIPAGYGKVTGILSVFGSDWQLTLRDTSDLKDFSGTIPPPPGGGEGTFEEPYDIAYAMGNTGETAVWVEGYIVGVMETDVDPFVANFAAPYRTNSNLLMAATAEETNVLNCVPVQLPAGAIRDALSLVTVEGNKGKLVKVLGNLEPYFSQAGVKGLTGYWLDGSGIVPVTGFFTEEFATTLGQFTGTSVTGDQVWEWASFDGGCAKMSGYANTVNNVNEDWLISSQISLTGLTGVKISFKEAINYITTIDDCKVLVSSNYDGTSNPNTATWTELTGFARAPGNNWTFVESGEVSLSAFEGQNIRIAFKYVSSATAGATWEVGRVVLTSAK